MANARTWIDTCFVCNKLREVSRHYGELMCNTCDNLYQRTKKRNPELTRDELLTKVISRKEEITREGKWRKNDARYMPNIRISIQK